MPTYEYACEACKHGFEIEQRITADFLRVCPKCKKHALVRLVGTGNFILKGSGWYSDLYSGGGAAKADPAEKADAPAKVDAPAKADAPAKTEAPAKVDAPSAASSATKKAAKGKSEKVG